MGTSGLIFALLRRVLPYIHVPLILRGSLKEWPSPHQRVIWTPSWMVNLFHQPEKGLPVTQHSLRPIRAFIQHGCPCYKFSYLFQSGHFTFYSHPQPQTPPPPPPPPPSGYARFFNRWFTFFLREVDNIWLFEQVFWRALTKKKMVNPNPNPPHPPPPPRYGRFLNRWFTFFLREGLWQKHMALDSSHLNEGRSMGASKNWNIPSLGPYHWFPSLIHH